MSYKTVIAECRTAEGSLHGLQRRLLGSKSSSCVPPYSYPNYLSIIPTSYSMGRTMI